MFAKSRTNHVSACLVAGLIFLAPAAAFAVAPEQTSRTAPGAEQSTNVRAALLHGRVTNEAGAPIADVRVRVAVPATDMRLVDTSTRHDVRETRSDAGGVYRLEISGLAGRTTISLDAMKPGYRRLVGTLLSGGDPKSVEVGPASTVEASLVLRPALYFAGKVVDERGNPIPSVEISATVAFARGSGGIERTATRSDGSFELFNYPERPPGRGIGATRGVVFFFHRDHIDTRIDDLYKVAPEKRGTLRIVLPTGYKVTGSVVDVAGKPVLNAMVKAIHKDGTHRKATMTDAGGMFALRGLSPGLTLLSARALAIKQSAQLPMALNGDRIDLDIRLRPIPMPANLETLTVLGMRLTDVTPELKSAYELDREGALVLDPGKDFDRLKIGQLAEGCSFVTVGRTPIHSVREFVNRLLAETAGRDAQEYRIRVVYTFSRADFDGTNTQSLTLTKDDLTQLRALSDQLTP